MTLIFQKLWAHIKWADERLLATLEAAAEPPTEAIREYAHILAADEVWFARLDGRASRAPVWPEWNRAELRPFAEVLHRGYTAYVAQLTDTELRRVVSYRNTKGDAFDTPVGEILTHVALHAQYHRGKVNLLLRQAGLTPIALDYILFLRTVEQAGAT